LKVLLVHPGSRWSTADVDAGLRHGLESHGVEVVPYRLDARLARAKSWLFRSWRARKDANVARPTTGEALLQAGVGALEQALRHQVDAVVIVSAILLHPDVVVLLRRAGLRVYTVFTESPYDHAHECRIAGLVDGCWTHERTVVDAFRAINPNSAYLPHGWHEERHGLAVEDDRPGHDVVFVGSGFPERVAWFNAINWDGIDLGLYGIWDGLGLKPQVQACVKSGPIDNEQAATLYRQAKVGLNLYRRTSAVAESLNPRAYELAACGTFSISEHRAESVERFGNLVPTFSTPQEAEALIRQWVAADGGRAAVQSVLSVLVADASWTERAGQVLENISQWAAQPVSAAMTTASDARLFDQAAAPKPAIPAHAFLGQHWYQAGGAA
jgi:spore maturation protein CgeB